MSIFDTIQVNPTTSLTLHQGANMELIVGQLQSYCNKMLCIIRRDGESYLRFLDSHRQLPATLKLEHKQLRNGVWEYYFSDVEHTTYCVFGSKWARAICPSIPDTSSVTKAPLAARMEQVPPLVPNGKRNVSRNNQVTEVTIPVEISKPSSNAHEQLFKPLHNSVSTKMTVVRDGEYTYEFPDYDDEDVVVSYHKLE